MSHGAKNFLSAPISLKWLNYFLATVKDQLDQCPVFPDRLYTDGTGFTVLHNFTGAADDGSGPHGSLTLSGQTLYGMTRAGGSTNFGTIFKINTDGTGFAVLYSFTSAADGGQPCGSLTLSGQILYRMTYSSSNFTDGSIFRINTDGTGFAVLYSFTGLADGDSPSGSLTLSGSTLYGMALGNGSTYAFAENFVLVLSHDEVVYGKRSLLDKMPGDPWQKFANLRLLFAYMYAQPGKKLMFMGGEFGQWWEWNSNTSLDWHLLQEKPHETLQTFVKDLNTVYRQEPALHELDFTHEGFEWIDFGDYEQSVVAFIRRAKDRDDFLVFVFNFTPVPRHGYRIGVPKPGFYRELLNSDSEIYGGSNVGNLGGQETEALSWHGRPHSLLLDLPPLAGLFLKPASE